MTVDTSNVRQSVASFLLETGQDQVATSFRLIAASIGRTERVIWTSVHELVDSKIVSLQTQVGRPKKGQVGGSLITILDRPALEALAKPRRKSQAGCTSTLTEDSPACDFRPPPGGLARVWWVVGVKDLAGPEALQATIAKAVRLGLLEDTDRAAQLFVAALARARRKARDVIRFLCWMVRRGAWHMLACRDEDAGRKLLAPVLGKFELPAGRVGGLVEMLVQRLHRPQVQTADLKSHLADRRAAAEREIARMEQKARVARLIHEGREAARLA